MDATAVREMALSLPGTEERISWGMPTFRVVKGIFVSLADDELSMGFRFPKEERAEMIAAEPDKFFTVPGHDDHFHWLRVRLEAIDAAELREIVVDSWRQLAAKKLVAEFDSQS